MRVLSLLPEARFLESGVTVPEALQMRFVPDLDQLTDRAEDTDMVALLVPPSGMRLGAASLRRFPQLRFVQTSGAGYDSVDMVAAEALGVVVANSPGMNAVAVAEYVFAAIVTLQRGLALADREIRAGQYTAVRRRLLDRGCLELAGSTVGLVGLGGTAQALVPLLRALDCTVLAHDVHWPEAFATRWHIQPRTLDALFTESDVVSLHCPLLDSTRHLVNYARLSRMRPNAVLVNAARGGVVNDADLARALDEGRLRGAALDVFENEHLEPDSPLLRPAVAERLIFSPHLAGVTQPAFRRMLTQALKNLGRVLNGQSPDHTVSPIPPEV